MWEYDHFKAQHCCCSTFSDPQISIFSPAVDLPCVVWDLIVSLSLQPIGLSRMPRMENADQLSTRWLRQELWGWVFGGSKMPKGSYLWLAFQMKQDVKMARKYLPFMKTSSSWGQTSNEHSFYFWHHPVLYLQCCTCMTEMVIFALCDSSHFEGDIWLELSPQCMM